MINGAGEFASIKAKFYKQALPYLHYDAMGIGEMEARYMKENGDADPFSSSVTVISANVMDVATRKPLAHEPYVIKKTKNGLKVGIISVLSDTMLDQFMRDKIGIQTKAVKEALENNLAKLHEKSDLVVLLYHGDLQSAKAIAAEFKGIDIILVGHASGMNQEKPEQVNKVIIMGTRSSGKYVGKLVLDIAADRTISASTGEYVPMDTSYADDPEMLKLIAQNDKDIEDYYARMRMQYARYTGDPTQPRTPQPFVTDSKCRECHAQEHNSWRQTGHAKAFEALRKGDRVHDPECISCHSTGNKLKGGFTSEEMTPGLMGVQCESCHGPGVIHSRRPAKGYGAVMQSTCAQCHDRANSPKFDYDVYRTRILHKSDASGGVAVTPVAR